MEARTRWSENALQCLWAALCEVDEKANEWWQERSSGQFELEAEGGVSLPARLLDLGFDKAGLGHFLFCYDTLVLEHFESY